MFKDINYLYWLIIIICCSILGCNINSISKYDNNFADIEKLLVNFEQVVFVDEYDDERKYNYIRKWTDPIKIGLFGDKATYYRATVEDYSTTLSSLTGLSIEVLGRDHKNFNFEIHFVPWDDMEKLAEPHSPNPEWLETIIEDSSCLFIYHRNKTFEIKHAFVFVSIDEPVKDIKSCLLEEMTQALGFPNDSDIVQPSIFNQWDHLQHLTMNDQILVRTLYDKRLKAGMQKGIALQYARNILDELIK